MAMHRSQGTIHDVATPYFDTYAMPLAMPALTAGKAEDIEAVLDWAWPQLVWGRATLRGCVKPRSKREELEDEVMEKMVALVEAVV